MTSVRDLDEVVSAHDLGQHPFYRAWREGTLPRSALARYAAEYRRFIAAVPQGWGTLGYAEHADEERRHAALWGGFERALGARPGACPEVDALVAEAESSFASRAAAVGALYAFEAQQPHTAKSKLEGLRAHYDVGADGEAYFALHADDYGERELLRLELAKLGETERDEARRACERTCRAMWRALDGVFAAAEPCAATA